METDELNVGDRVRINQTCIPPYVGMSGKVIGIANDNIDGFTVNVQFDEPLEQLQDEWFSPNELYKC